MTYDVAEGSPTVNFLLALRRIDKEGITARDVLILYTVMSNPGCNGIDVLRALSIKDRSSIQLCLLRLISHGFIEDRRTDIRKAVPVCLHVTALGLEFWNELKP
jgi:hypothetical protein